MSEQILNRSTVGLLGGDVDVQPSIVLGVLELVFEEIFHYSLLVDQFAVVPEGDQVLRCDFALGVLYYKTAHDFLLLAHRTVLSDQEPGSRERYLHILRGTRFPAWVTLMMTGQCSGKLVWK